METCFESEGVWRGMKQRGKSAISVIQSSSKVVLILFVSLIFVILISQRFDDFSFITSNFNQNGAIKIKSQEIPINLSCPNTTDATVQATCNRSAPFQSLNRTSFLPSSSCPQYFRYIYEDLKYWRSTGITREMLEAARPAATFRLVIIDGRAYIKKYGWAFQTRDVFTIWGFIQLLNRYPGRVPDLELLFDCGDYPRFKADDYRDKPPPPLFKYCRIDETLEIVFPDWSFWGWAEINIKPWEQVLEEIKMENKKTKWRDREPYAQWKGNPNTSDSRKDLMTCNVSSKHDWYARLFTVNWLEEWATGFKKSNLAKECTHRYKIYIDGVSWSVSEKYITACDSPTLLVTTRYVDFYSRGMIPGQHYWPIRPNKKCRSIKHAVDWGNKHPKQAEEMGRAGSRYIQEDVSMDRIYEYMLHLLTEYAKLLRFKPTIPENATEICLESMVCHRKNREREFMMESMVKSVYDFEPCTLPRPFDQKELQEIESRKEKFVKEMEMREDQWNE